MQAIAVQMDLETVLSGYFLKTGPTLEDVVQASTRYINNIVRRIADDLPVDVRPEVAQEVWLRLADETPTTFDPARGTGKQYLFGLVRNAVRTVRRSYGLPVSPGDTGETTAVAVLRQRVDDDETVLSNLVDVKATADVVNRVELNDVLSKANEKLRVCLGLAFVQAATLQQAAHSVGWSRFKLRRELEKLRRGVNKSPRRAA
jgi:hypothetical protein